MNVLLIELDDERRARLSAALHAAGMKVAPVRTIAEIERWPAGQIVVTDVRRFTPWWKQVGATHVIVLADTMAQGIAACASGATSWLPYRCSPGDLVTAVHTAVVGANPQDTNARSERPHDLHL